MPDAASLLDQLHVEVTGSRQAPPLLMLHGWGSSAALMRPFAQALEDVFRVHNIDLPGHGATPPPPEPWGVPEYAALVAQYIRATMDGGPVPVVGHSNGGRIALFMAAEPGYASLLSRLVLVSPSGVTPRRTLNYHLKKATAQALKAPFQVLPPRLRDFGLDWLRHSLVWKLLGSSDYSTLSGTMRGTFVKTVTFHLDDRLHLISHPTLLFWGSADTAVQREQMDTLAQGMPDAGLFVLEGAGHYGYLDAIDVVAEGTRRFLGAAALQPASRRFPVLRA